MQNLRKLEEKDHNQLMRLLYQLTAAPVVLNIDELLNDSACNCIVIEDDGYLAGFATLVTYYLPSKGIVGKIEDVVVDEGHRGKGYGRDLINELIKIAKEKNIKQLSLTSNPKREVARELYKKLGFKIKDTDVFILDL